MPPRPPAWRRRWPRPVAWQRWRRLALPARNCSWCCPMRWRRCRWHCCCRRARAMRRCLLGYCSRSLWLRPRALLRRAAVAAAADPVPSTGHGTHLARLPGAREEARRVAAAWPRSRQRLLLGTNAATGPVLQALASPETVVHLGTHGLVQRDGLELSGLLVVDGTGTLGVLGPWSCCPHPWLRHWWCSAPAMVASRSKSRTVSPPAWRGCCCRPAQHGSSPPPGRSTTAPPPT